MKNTTPLSKMLKRHGRFSKISKIYLAFIVLFFFALSSCDIQSFRMCLPEDVELLEKIEDGNYESYIEFMNKHENPSFACSPTVLTVKRLKHYVRISKNTRIYSDYLNRTDTDQEIKNEFLKTEFYDTSDSLLQIILDSGAEFTEISTLCDSATIYGLKRLHKMGYNLNEAIVDNSHGSHHPENLFMTFATVIIDKNEDCSCILEVLKFLVSIGIDTHYKDNKGKTVFDKKSRLSPCINEYLETLE
jgi:hypothetical protein